MLPPVGVQLCRHRYGPCPFTPLRPFSQRASTASRIRFPHRPLVLRDDEQQHAGDQARIQEQASILTRA